MFVTVTEELSPGYEVTETVEIIDYDALIAVHDEAVKDSLKSGPNALQNLDRDAS